MRRLPSWLGIVSAGARAPPPPGSRPETPHARSPPVVGACHLGEQPGFRGLRAPRGGPGDRTPRGSLRAGDAAVLADGDLAHLAWQADAFGFHLASIEVRQHAAVDEIETIFTT